MVHLLHKHKSNKLREWAKFFSGVVACDLAAAIWFLYSDLIPYTTVFGFNITGSFVNFGIVFDVFLLIVLVNYAWHPRISDAKFTSRGLLVFIGIVTGIVALIHIARLVFGWDFVIGSWPAPFWLSWLGALITAFISYSSFYFARK